MENNCNHSRKNLKMVLFGYGKMGKLIEKIAIEQGHAISAIIDSKTARPLPSATQEALAEADVCLDFSHPHDILDNIRCAAAHGKSIVVGTTGWEEHLEEAHQIANNAHIGFLYSPNFSFGVALFLKMAAHAAALIDPFPDYDVSGLEIHHKNKIDQPSGTAKEICRRVDDHLAPARKKTSFASIRVGNTPGTHSLIFDSPSDTITLTHSARNREGFAHGAIKAALWIACKKGIFTLDDMMDNS